MTLSALRRFRTTPLALRAEPGDVVYSGPAASACRTAATDAATAATARGDTVGAAQWTNRATALATVQQVAPGAVGIRWRESQERVYFIVPGVGLVQSLHIEEFITEFSEETDEARLYEMHLRGVEAVYALVEGWGWSAA